MIKLLITCNLVKSFVTWKSHPSDIEGTFFQLGCVFLLVRCPERVWFQGDAGVGPGLQAHSSDKHPLPRPFIWVMRTVSYSLILGLNLVGYVVPKNLGMYIIPNYLLRPYLMWIFFLLLVVVSLLDLSYYWEMFIRDIWKETGLE